MVLETVEAPGILWEKWPVYLKVAERGLLRVSPDPPSRFRDDWVRDIALSMIESGHLPHADHAKWRAIDLLRKHYSGSRYTPTQPREVSQATRDELGYEIPDRSPSPEFIVWVKEEIARREALVAPDRERPVFDYVATPSAEAFFVRWGADPGDSNDWDYCRAFTKAQFARRWL